ncbi:hypothetical protein KKH3_39340 [Pectobacterium actinidiae]|nr:hypothetical protein KKH3_39340 [Pectobacterium actinidiae]
MAILIILANMLDTVFIIFRHRIIDGALVSGCGHERRAF